MYNKALLLLFFFSSSVTFGQSSLDANTKDSIHFWIKNSKNTSLQSAQCKLFLNKAYRNTSNLKESKYKSKTLSSIAYRYYTLKDTITF